MPGIEAIRQNLEDGTMRTLRLFRSGQDCGSMGEVPGGLLEVADGVYITQSSPYRLPPL